MRERKNSTYVHIEAGVVVRVAHVSNVDQPNVSHIKDLVSGVREELLEIRGRLNQVTKPDHGGQIMLPSLKIGTS